MMRLSNEGNSGYSRYSANSCGFGVVFTRTDKPINKPPKKSIKEKQKENIEKGKPRNAGLPWNDELKKEVALMYQNGNTVEEMAVHFERTEGAISSELTHQGLIKIDNS